MSQPTSTAFQTAAGASVNDVTFGFLVSWDKAYNSAAKFFTIGTSSIAGPDMLKGAGTDVTFFDKYEYKDETPFVNELTVSRLSSVKPYGVFAAQADITLDNTAKRYLPGFDPVIGASVNKNRRPFKLAVGFSGENLQQFVGFSDRPKAGIMSQKMKMHGFDVIDYFNNVDAPSRLYQDYTFKEIIQDILTELGFTASQFQLDDSLQQAAGFISTTGMKAGQVFAKICEAEQGVIFADEHGIIRFWNRQHFAGKGFLPVAGSYDYTNLTDVEWNDTAVTNYVRVVAKPRRITGMQPVFQLASSQELKAGATGTIVAQFEDSDGKLPVTSVINPVEESLRDDTNRSWYRANTAQDGTGTPITSGITITSVSLAGDVAFINFSNTLSFPVYITGMEIHGTPAKVFDHIEVEYKDQTSIDSFGVNPDSNKGDVLEVVNDWIQDKSTALALAKGHVDMYADPEPQVSGTVFGNPSRQYGDVVDLRINDVQATARKAIVVGTELKMSMGNILAQKLIFEYRDAILMQQFFTINQSAIGGLDAIAP